MALTAKPIAGQYTNGPVIGYNNLLTSAAVTAGDTSGTVSKAIIPNTFERWRPTNAASTARFDLTSNADVNFVGIAAHNLANQALTIQYATSDGGALTTITTITPSTNDPILITFDAINVREIAIDATWAGTREIGYISAGSYLKMPYPVYGGHKPITLNADTQYQNNVSDSGQFLGRNIIRQGINTSYSFRYLDPDFVRSDFNDFMVSARQRPFFMQWRPDLYPNEVAFGYTTNDIQLTNSGGGIKLMDASFNMRGHSDV